MTTIGKYTIMKTIGTGTYSKVKLAKDENDNLVAIKIMKHIPEMASAKDNETFYNEVNNMNELRHPNIINLIDYCSNCTVTNSNGSSMNVAYMVLEFAEAGEMFDYISETGKFNENEARYFFHQLIDVIEFIHSQGYSHRDLKPENILLDKNFNIKIADFGYSSKEEVCHSVKGTIGYMAPEVMMKKEYKGWQEDLFSAAVILFIMLTQYPPFMRAEPRDEYYKSISEGRWDEFWEKHSDKSLSEDFIDLFSNMTSFQPSDRFTIEEIKANAWYKGPVSTSEEIIRNFSERHTRLMEIKSEKKSIVEDTSPVKAPQKRGKYMKQKKEKKYTKYIKICDGEELVNTVIDFALLQKFEYVKSADYFRVELFAYHNLQKVHLQVNVLSKPDNGLRCLEFSCLEGDNSALDSIFSTFTLFFTEKYENLDEN